jgi:hypothetical protein
MSCICDRDVFLLITNTCISPTIHNNKLVLGKFKQLRRLKVQLFSVPGWVATTWNVELHGTVGWPLRGGRGLQNVQKLTEIYIYIYINETERKYSFYGIMGSFCTFFGEVVIKKTFFGEVCSLF